MVKKLMTTLALAAGLGVTAATAQAISAEYPEREVRIIVPWAPGGPADISARLVAQQLEAELGKPFLIENRPGASGIIGTQAVKNAAPDGYTLVWGTPNFITVPPMNKEPPFDPLADFEPVSITCYTNFMFVAAAHLPVGNVKEMVEYIRANPASLYASPGAGSMNELAMESLLQQNGLAMRRVPYSGGAPALNALLTDVAQFTTSVITVALPLIEAGKVKPIAVLGDKRSPLLPDVATASETVPELTTKGWYGILAPKGTAVEISEKINASVASILADPEFQKKFLALDLEIPEPMTIAQQREFLREQNARWTQVIKAANITMEQ